MLLQDIPYVVNEFKDIIAKNSVIILEGDLGAGKTTFVKNFLDKDKVSSPTYSLVNQYEDILHLDLYRLNDPSELVELELELYLDETSFCFVEWGTKYLKNLKEFIGDEFSYYRLSIVLNEVKTEDTSQVTRNYELSKLH